MGLRIEKRAEWGAREPKARRYDTDPRGVVIHWPGADTRFRAMTHDGHERVLRQWQAMHMLRSNDLEYGSVICPCSPPVWMEGRTETRRPMVRVGSNGTATANQRYTSVQLMLGTEERIDDEMIRAAGEAVARLRLAGWGREVLGHRDCTQTSCPGDSIYGALGAIRAAADEWPPAAPDDWLVEGIIPMTVPTIVFFRIGNTWNEGNHLAGTYQAYTSQAKLDARKAQLREQGIPFTTLRDPVDSPAAFGRRAGDV